MKKIMVTLGASLIISTSLAQNNSLTPPKLRAKKINHGHTVSTAARQTYSSGEKGKYVSRIARLNGKSLINKKPHPSPPKRIALAPPNNTKAKAYKLRQPNRPEEASRRVLVQRPGNHQRAGWVKRQNNGRRPKPNGRFTEIRRG